MVSAILKMGKTMRFLIRVCNSGSCRAKMDDLCLVRRRQELFFYEVDDDDPSSDERSSVSGFLALQNYHRNMITSDPIYIWCLAASIDPLEVDRRVRQLIMECCRDTLFVRKYAGVRGSTHL